MTGILKQLYSGNTEKSCGKNTAKMTLSVCVAIKIFARYVAVFSCARIFWGENKEKVIGELWVNKVGIYRKEKSVV